MSERGPRRRNPRTRHDVADVLDGVEHRRWVMGGDQTDALRGGLESEALARIARVAEGRHNQATDLLLAGRDMRRPSAFTGERGPLAEEFDRFYAARHEPGWACANYADTLSLLIGHLDDEAREAAALIAAMTEVCPAALPREDVCAVAAELSDEWRSVLKVTQRRAAELASDGEGEKAS